MDSRLRGNDAARVFDNRTVHQRKTLNGFTLIEMMVVLIIISIFATVTVLSMEGMHSRDAEQEVERLRRVLEIAAETASVRGMPLTVEFQAQGYRFSALDAAGEWQLLFTPKNLAEHAWYEGMSVASLSVNGRNASPPYKLVFGSESPEFRLTLNTQNGTRVMVGKMSGAIEMETPTENQAPN